MGYTKLFDQLIASSIWDEDDATRLVWITMLALKDRNHFVRGTERFLELAARVSPGALAKALQRLSSPDPKSKNQEKDGRRVETVPGGWYIVSGEKYQSMLTYEERREYQRVKQAEYRRRKKHILEEAKIEGARQALDEGFEEVEASKAEPAPTISRTIVGLTPDSGPG